MGPSRTWDDLSEMNDAVAFNRGLSRDRIMVCELPCEGRSAVEENVDLDVEDDETRPEGEISKREPKPVIEHGCVVNDSVDDPPASRGSRSPIAPVSGEEVPVLAAVFDVAGHDVCQST